jgi:hypothetical protein
MSRNGIDGLGRAGVSLRRSRIDEEPIGISANAFDELGIDGRPTIDLARIRANGARLRETRFGGGLPLAQGSPTSVDHGDALVANRPQHPPGPGGCEPAAGVVIEDHLS